MTRFSGMTRARLAGVLVIVPACLIGAGFFVVSSLAAPANPVPAVTASPPDPSTSPTAVFSFSAARDPVTFLCALDTAAFTPCAGHIAYPLLADGRHTLRVEARYGSGISAPASYTWKITPRAPVIIWAPTRTSTTADPEFGFTEPGWPGLTFTCSLDSGAPFACTGDTDHDEDQPPGGEWHFRGLAAGPHCFAVYATDRGGVSGPATRFCWTITVPAAKSFTVGGDLTALLYPGTSQPLNLTFTNPGPASITIPDGNISARNITIASHAPGCAASNFAVTQGLTASVTIPAHQSAAVSLSALGVPQAKWPRIAMIETNTNQDACQGAQLTLTYAGIEAGR